MLQIFGSEPKVINSAVNNQEIAKYFESIKNYNLANKYFVKSYLENYPDTIETVFLKLDTSKIYNNLFQLKEFEEYKNSPAYGQTMLGEINSIDYYESKKTKNKFLITFETTFQYPIPPKTIDK